MPRMKGSLAGLIAIAAAVIVSACGGGGSDNNTATGPRVDATALQSCLNKAGVKTGPVPPDALLASYGQQATGAGGATFVVTQPLSQIIVFPDPVDIDEAKSELGSAEQTGGLRADALHADTLGNALIVYFVGTTPETKAPIETCLGGKGTPVPGFEVPYHAAQPTPQTGLQSEGRPFGPPLSNSKRRRRSTSSSSSTSSACRASSLWRRRCHRPP